MPRTPCEVNRLQLVKTVHGCVACRRFRRVISSRRKRQLWLDNHIHKRRGGFEGLRRSRPRPSVRSADRAQSTRGETPSTHTACASCSRSSCHHRCQRRMRVEIRVEPAFSKWLFLPSLVPARLNGRPPEESKKQVPKGRCGCFYASSLKDRHTSRRELCICLQAFNGN
jgi:hypothetical protein